MVYVYLLRDGNGKVVDIGESKDPKSRLYHKTKNKPAPGHGHFYGRLDIIQEIVSSWSTRKEARVEEERLKIYYGLEVTERTRCGHNKKLTIEQANEIRTKYILGKYSQRKLAEEYGLAVRAITNILHNKTYT